LDEFYLLYLHHAFGCFRIGLNAVKGEPLFPRPIMPDDFKILFNAINKWNQPLIHHTISIYLRSDWRVKGWTLDASGSILRLQRLKVGTIRVPSPTNMPTLRQ